MEIPCLGLPAAEREGREERGKSVGEGREEGREGREGCLWH